MKHNQSAGKQMSNVAIMLRMLGLVGPFAWIVVLAVLCGIAGHCCATFLPVLAVQGGLVAAGVDTTFALGLRGIVTVLVIMAIARGVLHYAEQTCNHYIAFKLLAHVRDLIFASLCRLCPAKLAGADRGDLISTITSDVELLEVFYAHTISPIAIAIGMALIMTCYLGHFHPLLGLVGLIAYIVIGACVPVAISKRSGDVGAQVREQSGRLSSFVLDSMRGLSEILQFGAGQTRINQLDEESRRLVDHQRVLSAHGGAATAATSGLIVAFDLCELVCAVALEQAGAIDSTAMLLATVALLSSFGPFVALAALGTTLQGTLAAGRRVLAILDEEPVVQEVTAGTDVAFDGAAAEHVNFSYTSVDTNANNSELILRDVNVDIPKGSIVGITGKSGSGKSTLCRLFMRFWDVDSGRIAISGADVRDIRTDCLRATEALVEQDTYLFHDSIRDNLLIARPDATQEQIKQACREASLDEFIESLPHGYDTMVGELGDTLSGGERQRMGLARAFLHDAPFLLLDEPTSNLDSLNEAAVLQSLDAQRGRRTVVLISHRASTMGIADITVSMDNGRAS